MTARFPGTIQSVQYVRASDVFFGHADVWEKFCEYGADFSWGDNNLTLVSADRVVEVLNEITKEGAGNLHLVEFQCDIDDVSRKSQACATLGLYIDLES